MLTNLEAKELIEEIKNIQKDVDYGKLKIRDGNNVDYYFSDYKTFKELFRELYYKKTTIDYVERKQDEITGVMGALKGYAPRDNKYVEAKNELVNNVENFYKERQKTIEGFKNGVFPFHYNEAYEYQMKAQREMEEEEIVEKRKRRREKKEEHKKKDKKPFDPDEVIEWMINREKTLINNELFKKHFQVQKPIIMYKVLYETNDKEKNNKLVDLFNSGLKDLEEEIKKFSKK